MDHSTIIILVVACALLLLLLLYLLRGRKQHVRFGDLGANHQPPPPTVPRAAEPVLPPEGHDVGAEVTAAIENVVDQFVGLASHPSAPIAPEGDRLTLLKGLGPRAATRLGELGVTRFEQIAQWDETDVIAIDAQMGAFKGRIARDRWVEQARLLARGDQDSFEAEFGKLGG